MEGSSERSMLVSKGVCSALEADDPNRTSKNAKCKMPK